MGGYNHYVVTPPLFSHLEAAVEVLLHRPAGLFVDLDGTLADIASTPAEVEVPLRVREDLERIGRRLAVGVLTGREAGDARAIVGSDELLYAGSHGAQWWQAGHAWFAPEAESYISAIHTLAVAADRRFTVQDGYIVEDKGASMSVHYRLTDDPAEAKRAVFEFLADSPEAAMLFVSQGKMVAEVRPSISLTKGSALRTVVQTRGLAGAIVIGDDTTDLDMFRAMTELRATGSLAGIAIAVLGPEVPPELVVAADYTLQDPRGVRRFLGWLAEKVE
jgi:trehalose 6-phosphate phosphatase